MKVYDVSNKLYFFFFSPKSFRTWLALSPNARSTKCHKFFIKKAFAVVRMESNRKASTRRIKTDSLKRPLELRNWLTYAKGEVVLSRQSECNFRKSASSGTRNDNFRSSHYRFVVFQMKYFLTLLDGYDERSARARINKKRTSECFVGDAIKWIRTFMTIILMKWESGACFVAPLGYSFKLH